MSEKPNLEELELSDAELIEVLKNHGMDRRTLMRAVGVGAGVAALGGTAAGKSGRGNRIDEIYGAPYAADVDTVPSGLVDHVVELHVHQPGVHEGFPTDPESGEEIPAEFIFDPVGLHVKPGEIVAFRTHDGLHTVTSFHPKFSEPPFFTLPDRVATDHAFTSPPVVAGDSWLYRFTKQGVYDLLCLPHLFVGMVMRIVVSGDGIVPDDTYGPLPIPNAGAVLGAPEMTPSNIVGEGVVEWEELTL